MSEYDQLQPLSALTLFDADKKALGFFAECVALEVNEGRENALRIEAIAKKTIKTMEDILSRIKDASINEASKYGERPFMFANCEMHYTQTKTEYNYEQCNDPLWWKYNNQEKAANRERKDREAFLKALKEPTDIRFEDELVTVIPPTKKETMGVKVTMK